MASERRILVPCVDWTKPADGVQEIYHQVDVLNAHGIAAFVMHQQQGFRCTWFDSATAVTSFDEAQPLRQSDVLMVPEPLAWQFASLAPGVPKVILNQNAYRTFAWREPQDVIVPYRQPDFLATIVRSEDSRRYLEYVFPGHRVFRIHCSLDPRLFYRELDKRLQIAYVPQEEDRDIKQVLGLLRYRGAIDHFPAVAIKDKADAEAAAILRQSVIFLSFGEQEGWPQLSMEAMACGCVSIGYDGGGGEEFFREPYATCIPSEDVVGFARAVEETIAQLQADPRTLMEKTSEASQFVRSTFTPQRQEQDMLDVWDQILRLAR